MSSARRETRRSTPPESSASRGASPRLVVVVLATWLVAALVAGATGRVALLQPPAPQVVALALTIAAILASRLVPPLRAWCDGLDLRWLVALHLLRLVAGTTFLAFHAMGRLPRDFAVPAGWGDIAVALFAAALLLAHAPETRPGARLRYLAWNVFGLGDIAFVLVTAARLAMANPASMQALLHLPLCLLPTFLVPLIVASHALIFMRLARRSPG